LKNGSANALSLLVDLFPGFAQNFENAAGYHSPLFKRELCKSGKCVDQEEERDKNSKENTASSHSLQNIFVNSKAFVVKRLKMY
jgi:hypothetical protein